MLVAALAIVLVTAVLGGFREAAAGIVERAPGQTIDLGSLAVVVTGATLGPDSGRRLAAGDQPG